jgi:hypothetical protein
MMKKHCGEKMPALPAIREYPSFAAPIMII